MHCAEKEERIRAVCAYIDAHLQEKITVRELAVCFGLHPSYLNTFFCAQTGESIKTYIRRRKVHRAKEMILHSNYSLTQIGASLGFFDQSHFSRVFQKETGMTPGRYREAHQAALQMGGIGLNCEKVSKTTE